MTKKEQFIKVVDNFFNGGQDMISTEILEVAKEYFETFKTVKEKPQFTENGKKILTFLKDNEEEFENNFKATNIAEGLFISSKSVSGSIRKLITDGYVEKIGESPVRYALTDKGRAAQLN